MGDEAEQTVLKRARHLAEMSRAQARKLVDLAFRDGIVTREEAERLFETSAHLGQRDARWDARFIEAITDFLLLHEVPTGWVSNSEADWLLDRVRGRDGRVGELGLDLMLAVLRKAEGAPDHLAQVVLEAACARIRRAGVADGEDVDRLRRALFAQSSLGGTWITRDEANALFALNDRIGHARNHPAWNDLFARGVANHLMAAAHPDPDSEAEALAREAWLRARPAGIAGIFAQIGRAVAEGAFLEKILHDPRQAARERFIAMRTRQQDAETLNADETAWFMRQVGRDHAISPAEEALIAFLKAEAPDLTTALVHAA